MTATKGTKVIVELAYRHELALSFWKADPGTEITSNFFLASPAPNADTGQVSEKRAYLSLGSNVGDREENLRAAIRALGSVGEVVAVSSFYETEPVEFTAQPWFLNCVLVLETRKLPEELLRELLQVELRMGRRRTQKKGPRTIDIDIVLFKDVVVNTEDLTIPHPALHERRFVLEPLAEIAPDVVHPVLKKTARAMLEALPFGQAVKKAPQTKSD